MTERPYLLAWICAGACAALLIFSSFVFGPTRVSAIKCDQDNLNVPPKSLVIGSSLAAYAFGTLAAAEGSVGLAHPFIWAGPNLSADDAYVVAICALDLGVETIFIEASTLVLQYEAVDADTGSFANGSILAYFLHQNTQYITSVVRGRLISDGYRSSFYSPPYRMWPGPTSTAVLNGRKDNLVIRRWSLTGWMMAEKLRHAQYGRKGRIVLFEPPRTVAQLWDIEQQTFRPLEAEIQDMSDAAGLPILMIWPAWPDRYFKDYQSHLNETGSVAFLKEFQAVTDAYSNAW